MYVDSAQGYFLNLFFQLPNFITSKVPRRMFQIRVCPRTNTFQSLLLPLDDVMMPCIEM